MRYVLWDGPHELFEITPSAVVYMAQPYYVEKFRSAEEYFKYNDRLRLYASFYIQQEQDVEPSVTPSTPALLVKYADVLRNWFGMSYGMVGTSLQVPTKTAGAVFKRHPDINSGLGFGHTAEWERWYFWKYAYALRKLSTQLSKPEAEGTLDEYMASHEKAMANNPVLGVIHEPSSHSRYKQGCGFDA